MTEPFDLPRHPAPAAPDATAVRFDAARPRLQAMAARVLGSEAEADDAVQEAWLRLDRTDVGPIRNLDAWLTTVVARICLNRLRSRRARAEAPLTAAVDDPVLRLDPPAGPGGPEDEAELADVVARALDVVLDTLPPAERLAFVLHDVFAVPFDEIATVLDRSPAAVRQLASRARRRVRGTGDGSVDARTADPAHRRAVVDAFFRAARAGDLVGLVALLDPEVVLRSDAGPGRGGTAVVQGAEAVAGRAAAFASPSRVTHDAWAAGDPAVIVTVDGRVVSVMRFAVLGDRIVAVDAIADPARLAALEIPLGPAAR